MTITRIIVGTRCEWWDRDEETSQRINCPRCGSPLLEMDQDEWQRYVNRYEHTHPGYRKFIEWQRGKCFQSISQAQEAYAAEQAST